MHEFTLGSSNAGKAKELNELLGDQFKIITPSEKLDVVEDADSFRGNALLKAKAYYEKFNKPAVADDSGLVVPTRADILGIYSARFAPEETEYSGKMQKLIELMKDDTDRSAYFVCVLCFYLNPREIFYFEGRLNGEIGHNMQGDGGFGYDPVFYPENKDGESLAQLNEWKIKNSHRAKACREASIFFNS